MKKLLFLMLLSPALANAQKIAKDETDRFTKQHVKATDWNKLVYKGTNAVRISVANIDEQVFINFKVAQHGRKWNTVQEGDHVMLLMDDDQAVKLTIADSKSSKTDWGTSRGTDFELLEFPAMVTSLEDMKKLRMQNVKAIRIYLGNNPALEFDVAEKFTTAVKDCINMVM